MTRSAAPRVLCVPHLLRSSRRVLFFVVAALLAAAPVSARPPAKQRKLAKLAAKPVSPAGSAIKKTPAPKPVPKPRPKPAAYELLLTFDDGPRPDTTPKVLDTLDQFGIKAVFFVNGVRFMGKGQQADRAKELLRETLKRGHILGNHTIHHFFLCGKRGPVVGEQEIVDNAALIREATGQDPPLFRTPFGSRCPSLTATLNKLGIRPIGWDIDPQDWKLQDADKIFSFMTQELGRTTRARSIVLFHDVQPATADMLPRLLKWINEENAVRQQRGEPPFKFVNGSYLLNQDPKPAAAPAPAPPPAIAPPPAVAPPPSPPK